jgi:integral membrane protein (TIGR01906 family)
MSGMRERPGTRWSTFAGIMVQVLLPVVLLLTNVRLLMTDAFLQVEYRLPGFPDDRHGFTLEDRLTWAPIALEYLHNTAGTEFLGDLRFEDGSPTYNARELRHMDDVKRLSQLALRIWRAGLATTLLLLGGLWWTGRRETARRTLAAGARATLGLMAVLAAALALSFSSVFVGFHRVFFEGDSWLFLYSDTLIRLFPERFWRDAFIFIAGATLIEAVLILLAMRRRRPA